MFDSKKANRIQDHEKDHTLSVSLLEQKHKGVSSSIDVPHARKLSEEVDMDKVTAAMVLTSLSTSPLVHSPPVKTNGCIPSGRSHAYLHPHWAEGRRLAAPISTSRGRMPAGFAYRARGRGAIAAVSSARGRDGTNGSWKERGFTPSSYSSSGYWSWSAPSDLSNPSTPSPPLSADSCKPFRIPSQPDDGIDEADASDLLFNEPIPRKRKNSMKVMFKCLWKNCGRVLSTAAGIQKHIRTVHLGRSCDSDCSDGEEDFYYTEIKLNTDSVADGLSSLSPVSPSVVSPPHIFSSTEPGHPESVCMKTESKLTTPLSRSAPSTLYLVHADHAYQATAPVNIPGSANFTPSSSSFSISWQSPPVTFTGIPASPTHIRTHGFGEHRPQAHAALSSPPRAAMGLRTFVSQMLVSRPSSYGFPTASPISANKIMGMGTSKCEAKGQSCNENMKSRGEGKKCRKVYGMENRDMWCTACRWKKACQRFID
ncbi:ZN704 protein, partial [Polyodon spathula]|nr:ZN704 protein [Polyodon spathula]